MDSRCPCLGSPVLPLYGRVPLLKNKLQKKSTHILIFLLEDLVVIVWLEGSPCKRVVSFGPLGKRPERVQTHMPCLKRFGPRSFCLVWTAADRCKAPLMFQACKKRGRARRLPGFVSKCRNPSNGIFCVFIGFSSKIPQLGYIPCKKHTQLSSSNPHPFQGSVLFPKAQGIGMVIIQ